MQIMKNLAAEGKSILFISHKLNEIMEVSDRVTVLRKGKCIGTVETAHTTAEELSAMMVGRNVNFHVEKGPLHTGSEVLSVEHLTVASKVHKNNAVKDVSFRVRAGEIVCIAGIDGNGQTDRRIGIQLGLFLLTLEVFNTSAALGDFADLLSHSDNCYDIY